MSQWRDQEPLHSNWYDRTQPRKEPHWRLNPRQKEGLCCNPTRRPLAVFKGAIYLPESMHWNWRLLVLNSEKYMPSPIVSSSQPPAQHQSKIHQAIAISPEINKHARLHYKEANP